MLWFGKKKTPTKEPALASPPSPSGARMPAVPVAQRDLVNRVLKEVLRTYGVPPHWVTCELHALHAPAGPLRFELTLSMTKWNAQLLHYALTLQHSLLQSLQKTEATEFLVRWAFAPACMPPTLEVPNPASWVERPVTQAGTGALFDRRKKPRPPSGSGKLPRRGEVPNPSGGNDDQDGEGFAKTAIAPFL
jgi:hypothetical protein